MLALLVALAPAAATALGICRQEAARNDGYMQLLCEGETSLGEQQTGAAIEHFSAAAALPRRNASNELAWAGLAAAHCRAGDARAGRDWAQRFGAARAASGSARRRACWIPVRRTRRSRSRCSRICVPMPS